jgi:CheY-like chemotaxis protein
MTPLRLLVVEDDLASLELMVEVFRSLKAEVHPISDSEKVVGRTQQNNSYPNHQSRRKRTGTGHAFQLRTLLRAFITRAARDIGIGLEGRTDLGKAILLTCEGHESMLIACPR